MTTTQYGTWVSYGGSARIVLAVVLLAVAGGLALAGFRLPLPARATRPGKAVMTFILLGWVLALAAFLVCVAVYAVQARRDYSGQAAPTNPILVVTVCAAGITFFIILVSSREGGWTALVSATVAALAAPMIFELPFDLIVMARVYPALQPDPGLYRALFFLPLFIVEIITLSLLTFSPLVRVSRAACWSLAAMIGVFAVWALFGFGYPSTPAALTLNVLSKLLAFVTAVFLFLPQQARAASPA